MVTDRARARRLDAVLSALADPRRRAIVARLAATGPATVGDLARPFRITRPAISKHLRVLERSGLVRRTREGRVSRCRYDGTRLREAADWIATQGSCWHGRLDRVVEYLGGG
jgi:DNA-binding transcriptional ArsR family regulator